ncbi:uncharacterized protein PV09_08097 [Verruconis gallopava]|uniref:Uncharacterized protein n=1 Tax=Verruconis gallopava TaxID=253628 RepID=A0A0D2A141_9PEZI|nr:uncharacterized protein PV09_08097 [Verruconis gallopava]KIW00388.1 hypothetical protein PV09_08097 [Verruconis gallopava]
MNAPTLDTTDRGVSEIIHAFRESLKEFKKFREQKKAKKVEGRLKQKAPKAKREEANGDELRLSRSLVQGAVDVQSEYDRHYRAFGDRFALGDATAHSSLRRTLRKLNTCVYNILAAILKKEPRIDYQHLTSVSDVSRQEALDALSQLSYRMSVSALSLQEQKKKDEKHKRKRSNNARTGRRLPSSKSVSDLTERSARSMSGQRKGPEIKMVRLTSASTPQLAMVRPKARRSSSSKSDVCATPPLPSPAGVGSASKHRRHDSGVAVSQPTRPNPSSPSPPQPDSTTPQPLRRRADKFVPSVHTFASASTRLGEIPELKWSIPYDYEAMNRLNEEHGGRPWPPPPEPAKAKRGFLRLFKKSEMKAAEAAA